MKNIPTIAILTLGLLCGTIAQSHAQGRFTGEGRNIPGDKDNWKIWTKDVKMSPLPSASERAKELADRKAAMEAESTKLKERLKRAANPSQQSAINKKLEELTALYGMAAEIPRAMTLKDLEPMLKNQSQIPEGFLKAWIQFKKDLEARGEDLILMPVAPDCAIYMHLLVPGLTAQTEVWPGWTEMMIEFLENDIEIIDCVDAFRAEAKNPIPVIFPNDPHTGSLGRRIMGKALAERLQRYDFARALAPNRSKFNWETKTEPGNDVTSGTLYFSRAWDVLNQFDGQETAPTVPGKTLFKGRSRGKIIWAAPKNEAMVPGLQALEKTPFNYLEVKPAFSRPDECSNLDMVFIGDSQLHTAVDGSRLPEIVGAEVGGVFRWLSQSWSGFQAPEIYLRGVLQEKDENHPRVVVAWFLPFKFIKHDKEEYNPRPLPPYQGASPQTASATTTTAATATTTATTTGAKPATPAQKAQPLPKTPFKADIRITAVSQQKDPETVDYKEALTHSAAVIVGGPFDGREIGVRYWTMFDGKLIPASGKVKVGDTFAVTLQPWDMATRLNIGGISNHMVYNDTDQDTLTIPLYWVTVGPLAPTTLLPQR